MEPTTLIVAIASGLANTIVVLLVYIWYVRLNMKLRYLEVQVANMEMRSAGHLRDMGQELEQLGTAVQEHTSNDERHGGHHE